MNLHLSDFCVTSVCIEKQIVVWTKIVSLLSVYDYEVAAVISGKQIILWTIFFLLSEYAVIAVILGKQIMLWTF